MADAVDPRQRQAAAILLSAIDLPAPLQVVAGAWAEAAKVCPGITAATTQLTRAEQLRCARVLIDELLSEIQP
jgi:hypothetical protein